MKQIVNKSDKKSPAPAPAPAALGSKANPYTSDSLPPDYDENKAKYANAFFKTKGSQDNPPKIVQFDAEGKCELRGNWKGTAHEGRNGGPNSAKRLYELFTGTAQASRLNGESEADFSARQRQVELGNLMGKAVAPLIIVKLAKVEGGIVKRNLTIPELKAKQEFANVPESAFAFMVVPIEERIEAQEERMIFASELLPHHVLAKDEESRIRELLKGAPGAACRASA